MAKLTFEEALEKIGDGRTVRAADVQARALSRRVWVAEWHLPGCISESFDVCETKRDAIETACGYAEVDGRAPHGMKTALRKFGRFDSESELYGMCINTVERRTLADIL